jgi:DNA ligase-1
MGLEGLKKVSPEVGTPILMMRAERLSSGEAIIEKLGRCAIEPKFDGFRVQAHFKREKSGDFIRLFSRNLEDMTYMFPDLAKGVSETIVADEAIFEGEAIGYDPQTDKLLPFQETVQRKRKYDIDTKSAEIPLRLFVFDVLYKDGKSLINEPFTSRRKIVTSLFSDKEGKTIQVAKEEVTEDPVRVEEIFDTALAEGLEGILVKKLDGVYQAGARGYNWIKLKRSYSSKIDDTVDCVVMGYDFGQGKRTDFGIGAFLVGIYDEAEDRFVTVSKIGTGLTDDEWREMKERCDKLAVDHKPALYDIDSTMNCSVWVNPQIVVEIKADEITRSAMHTAGRIMKQSKSGNAQSVDESGYALRFPRLIRFRDDKKATDATSLDEVKALYTAQKI